MTILKCQCYFHSNWTSLFNGKQTYPKVSILYTKQEITFSLGVYRIIWVHVDFMKTNHLQLVLFSECCLQSDLSYSFFTSFKSLQQKVFLFSKRISCFPCSLLNETHTLIHPKTTKKRWREYNLLKEEREREGECCSSILTWTWTWKCHLLFIDRRKGFIKWTICFWPWIWFFVKSSWHRSSPFSQ